MSHRCFGAITPHPPIMVPAVGRDRVDATRGSVEAMQRVSRSIERYGPDSVVLMSPHAPAAAEAFLIDDSSTFTGSLSDFGDTRSYAFAGDPHLARAIMECARGMGVEARPRSAKPPGAGHLDHGSLVPLHFLEPFVPKLVIVSLSALSYDVHHLLGMAIRRAAQSRDARVAFIASGDLSHRLTPDAPAGFSPTARHLDAMILGLVEQGLLNSLAQIDPELIEAGGECGLRSIITLGGYCCEDPAPTRVLHYEAPWGVGYLTALVGSHAIETDDQMRCESGAGCKGGCAGDREHEIVSRAREVIEARLSGDPTPGAPPFADPHLPAQAGTFVSLHRAGSLRGCIGTIEPSRDSLALEVAHNAIQAAFADPRFPPLTTPELADLEISVDVLHPPQPCTFDELDPARYGVIVTAGGRRGLLLPDLDGVDDAWTQVSIASAKAGIAPAETVTLQRFRVDRYT